MAHCYLVDAGPTSSTAKVLERRVWVLLLVVEVQDQTTTAQGHIAGRVEWAKVLVGLATGLVPGFADYPSSTFVGTERMVVLVGEKGRVTRLSVDKVAVEEEEDMESELECSKRWVGGCQQ